MQRKWLAHMYTLNLSSYAFGFQQQPLPSPPSSLEPKDRGAERRNGSDSVVKVFQQISEMRNILIVTYADGKVLDTRVEVWWAPRTDQPKQQ